MTDVDFSNLDRRHEIPGRITLARGCGELPKICLQTDRSAAEVYLHGAHVTHFQKRDEPPVLFLSQSSQFAQGKPIRGGIPVIFPWFGPKEGKPMHGFARHTAWDWVGSRFSAEEGAVVTLALAAQAVSAHGLGSVGVEFQVALTDRLTLSMTVANPPDGSRLEFENCLHTYFAVSDIHGVGIHGLKGTEYLDKMDGFARKRETEDPLQIRAETDRVYLNTADTLEVSDTVWQRRIRIGKRGSHSTVVWNPWIAKARAMADFGDDEYLRMVCVESGNVASNAVALDPGAAATLQVTLETQPL